MGLMTGLLIAGAATSLYGSYKASQASKKASEQQAASADKALGLQREMYQQTRGDLAPFRQQGGQGLTALTSLLGLPGPPPGSPPGTPPVGTPGVKPNAAGGMVLLRAPTGQTQAVPANQVDYYLARGATRG